MVNPTSVLLVNYLTIFMKMNAEHLVHNIITKILLKMSAYNVIIPVLNVIQFYQMVVFSAKQIYIY